jgi:hypothetical protein
MPFKLKVIVWIVAGILGIYIPTSMLGLTIHNGFFAKQQMNCLEDSSNSIIAMLDAAEQSNQAREIENISSNLKTCRNNLDYNKGLVTSLGDEIARARSNTSAAK